MEPLANEGEIIERLAQGESLRSICPTGSEPSRATVIRRLATDEEFATRCARAREIGADAYAERMDEAAEDCINGKLDPQAVKVAVSTWQWIASKRAPKKYGDRITQEHTGPGGEPLTVNLHVQGVKKPVQGDT